MQVDRDALIEGMRENARQWGTDGSPFYEVLLDHMADDVAAEGPCWPVLRTHAENPLVDVPGVRLLGGVHRLVLEGRAPKLADHYPSVGGDGDAHAAWPAFRAVVAREQAELTAAMEHAPQTNEVGRSMALAGAWAVVAGETGLPLRLLEPGASAGLNLRADHYWFEAAGAGWGDPGSTVRFVDRWRGGAPPFGANARIVERRGCDRFPIDAASERGRLTLLSYVWPDERERFEILRAALDIAASVTVQIDEADAIGWLAAQLGVATPGVATVVYHSYFWQYLPSDAQAAGRRVLEDAAGRATVDAPIAHLSLELGESGEYAESEVRLRISPGGEARLLGRCTVHPTVVEWID